MRAVRFTGVGRPAQIEDVPKPSPSPGQILLKIGGSGVCHSDLHVMEEDLGFRAGFTLGHENAGWIAEAETASQVSRKATRWLSTVRGDAAAAMPASSRWRTIARTGLRSTGSVAALALMVAWRNTCWFQRHGCWSRLAI